ncbi:hypothetical protein Cgig2_013575 [Carnegiea gigantea]|uniref:Ferredoxin-thioredoxin reductase catalytic chain, chloroplastic n=1 Tax=Carnegiea gigantea TaxID=171969 RepID=A0A9Q1QF04_9CARY|nr:hypothetical protein Cgig2_013575 [Carnegiea gigantea]
MVSRARNSASERDVDGSRRPKACQSLCSRSNRLWPPGPFVSQSAEALHSSYAFFPLLFLELVHTSLKCGVKQDVDRRNSKALEGALRGCRDLEGWCAELGIWEVGVPWVAHKTALNECPAFPGKNHANIPVGRLMVSLRFWVHVFGLAVLLSLIYFIHVFCSQSSVKEFMYYLQPDRKECHCMLFLTPENDFAGKEQVSVHYVRTRDFTLLNLAHVIRAQHQTLG